MSDTHASISAKGLEGTGVTEDMAVELFHQVGTHLMAIVDLQVVDKHGPNLKGKRKVVFAIDSIEPANDDNVAEHLRELTRTMYFNRQVDQPLDGGEERTVDDVLAAGKKHEPHPYLASTLSVDDDAICDVCGQHEGAAVHAADEEQEPAKDGTEDPTYDENAGEEADEEYVDEGEWAEESAR